MLRPSCSSVPLATSLRALCAFVCALCVKSFSSMFSRNHPASSRMLYRQSLPNRKSQLPMRRPQRRLHLFRRPRPRKQKSQITRTLRPSRNVIVQPRRNFQPNNMRYPPRRFLALHALQHAASRHRNHHHSRSRLLAFPISHRHLRRVPQQQFLQPNHLITPATHKPQRPRAKPSNRPRRHFQRPHPLLIDPKLRMHRPVRKPQRPHGIRRGPFVPPPLLFPQTRGRNVNRLLEKRPLQRIRLIKNCQDAKLSIRHQPFHGHFPSRDVSLHQHLIQIRFPAREVAVEGRSEEHTSELQSPDHLVCRLLLEKKKKYSSIICTKMHTFISSRCATKCYQTRQLLRNVCRPSVQLTSHEPRRSTSHGTRNCTRHS